MDIYDSLNPTQLEAVMHGKGPLLILAGAGSGKTRVITHRIARLINDCGVSPYRILAITFTNKAAREMQERVHKLLDYAGEDVWISTFHAACVRMLRRYATAIGFGQNFNIYDTDDQKRAMRDVLKHINVDPKRYQPKAVLGVISSLKNELIGPEDYRSYMGAKADPTIGRAYAEYQEELRRNNAFDFDDLLMKTIELFRTSEEALSYYRERFEYILVDEYQDTNTAQFEFIRLLANHTGADGTVEHNLCVVGDDDQSIYRFRGANIRNILDFESTYADACVIKLEQNYRSTRRILDVANTVIGNNVGRKSKALWSDAEEGELIRVNEYPSDLEEAKGVVSDIAEHVDHGDGEYRDYAILYRTNAQSRAFEEQLVYRSIPYKLVGGTNFYDRMEIRDLLAYLRVVDSGDAIAVKRIINVPRRGIGDTTVDKLDEYAYIKDLPLYEALRVCESIPGISTRTSNSVNHFVAIIEELRSNLKVSSYSLPQLIDDILDCTGYDTDLKEQEPDRYDDRMDNIAELKNKLAQYVQSAEDATLSGFLAEVALVADVDSVDSDDDYVVLMTLHSAKGLEFDHVYIGGMEEGLFPSQMALNDNDGVGADSSLEEERRLCYVGITRARKTLALSYATKRMMHGELQFNRPSRFISELPRDRIRMHVESPSADSTWGSRSTLRRGSLDSFASSRGGSSRGSYGGNSYGSSSRSGNSYSGNSYGDDSRSGGTLSSVFGSPRSGKAGGYGSSDATGYGNPKGYGSSSGTGGYGYDSGRGYGSDASRPAPKTSSDASFAGGAYKNPYASASIPSGSAAAAPDYKVGDRVRHIKFGVGTVLELKKGSRDYEVTVQFEAGVKQMLAAFAKLTRVDS